MRGNTQPGRTALSRAPLAAAIWLAIGGAVFGLGWIGLGIDAIRRDRRPATGPAAA